MISVVTEYLGYYGNYGLQGGLAISAILYLKFFVKEIHITKEDEDKAKKSFLQKLRNAFINPLLDMASLFTRKREPIIRFLILLLTFVYCLYIFAYYSEVVTYLYMLLQFDGFTAADYAYFTVVMSIGNSFFLMVFMPIVSGKYRMNDALLLVVICMAETVSYLMMPFVTNLALFYAAKLIGTIGYCKYSVGRSLLTKLFYEDETGKAFAALSVVVSFTMMAVNPITRNLYDSNIGTFPGAFLLLSASLVLLSGFINFFIYTKTDVIEALNKTEEAKATFKTVAVVANGFISHI